MAASKLAQSTAGSSQTAGVTSHPRAASASTARRSSPESAGSPRQVTNASLEELRDRPFTASFADAHLVECVSVTFRPAGPDDSPALFRIFVAAVAELGQRLGVETFSGGAAPDPAELWPERRPLFDHLARTAAHAWLAEDGGAPLGYARSIARDGTLELTEFFVLPGRQSAGVGRELMARAFPAGGARHRSIIATPDLRALARYLRAGLAARFPIYGFTRGARVLPQPASLTAEPMDDAGTTLETVAAIDRANLGFRRDVDHQWLRTVREGWLFRDRGRLVGYGYVGGTYNGPFGVLDERDWPAVLTFAESRAATLTPMMSLDVPLVNRIAAGWLLDQGYRMSEFVNYYLSDGPDGRFERHIITTPSFFV
jgi:GNAT superfamily N-acetyltransferase